MKEDKFIKSNLATWQSLETTLKKFRAKGLQKFEASELNALFSLYNRTCGHLSYSRTHYGDTTTTTYLNKLVATSHSAIYTTKTSSFQSLIRFLTKEFSRFLFKNSRYFLMATLIFMVGGLASFIYTFISPDNAAAFLPPQFTDNGNLGGGSSTMWDSPVMSSYIFTNNIKVGFIAFALGVTLGIGTIYILAQNGFMLGALFALVLQQRAGLRFWSLILPHGILELFAIFVCGGAGLMLGHALIDPGKHTRKDTFILKGKAAVKLVCGTLPIFVIAGLIEGFFTPLPIPEWSKLTFAFFTLLLLVVYLILPNRKISKGKGAGFLV